MRKKLNKYCTLLLVLLLLGCQNEVAKVETFSPNVTIETIGVDFYAKINNVYEGDGITLFQDKVVICIFNDDLEYYLLSKEGNEETLLLSVSNIYETTALSTQSNLYIYVVNLDEKKELIYSCIVDKCKVIKEDFIQTSTNYNLITDNNNLYVLQKSGTNCLVLLCYDEIKEEWIEVERMKHENLIGPNLMITNENVLSFAYMVLEKNEMMLYMYQYQDDQKKMYTYSLDNSEYDGIGSYWPLMYKDHIAVVLHKKGEESCRLLINTGSEYVIQNSLIPCHYQAAMISENTFISALPRHQQNISKIYDDHIESIVVDYQSENIKFTDNNPHFYVIDKSTIVNLSNNDGNWHMIKIKE